MPFRVLLLYLLCNVNAKTISVPQYDIPNEEIDRMNLYWVNQAFAGLFSAIANQHIKKASNETVQNLNNCTNKADGLPAHTRCILQFINTTITSNDTNSAPARRTKRALKPIRTRKAYRLPETKEPLLGRISRYVTNAVRLLKGKQIIDKDKMSEALQLSHFLKDRNYTKSAKELAGSALQRNNKAENYDHANTKDHIRRKPPRKQEDAVSMVMKLGRQLIDLMSPTQQSGGKKADDNSSYRFLSPKFFSFNDEDDTNERDVLSPSILPIKAEGKEELQELVLELSGANDNIPKPEERAVEVVGSEEAKRVLGQGETERIDLFERIQHTFTDWQTDELSSRGYSTLTRDQRELVYGEDSIYPDPEMIENPPMTRENVDDRLTDLMRLMEDPSVKISVSPSAQHSGRRHKRQTTVNSVFIFVVILNAPLFPPQGFVLAPALLSAVINSPSIFGSLILSPWVFVPVINSPFLLKPFILQPFVGVPFILSPQVAVPAILSPIVMTPGILSPGMLIASVLSPAVLSPFVLSPYLLAASVLSPRAGTAVVLSPQLLVPSVFSPNYLIGIVLSPAMLSPQIASPSEKAIAILSPTFLS